MKTFDQFLDEQIKSVKMFGTGRVPAGKVVSAVRPAKPIRPVYTGLNLPHVVPTVKGK